MKKKQLISAALAAVMAVSLTACGGSSSDTGTSAGSDTAEASGDTGASEAPEGTTTIEVWTEDRRRLERAAFQA